MQSEARLTAGTIAGKWRRFAAARRKEKTHLLKRLLSRFLTLKLRVFFLHLGLSLISLGRPVRIGTLNAKGKISIMISYIEPYMRQLQVEGVRNPFVIVINPGRCPNEQLSKMYGRAVWLLDDRHPRLRNLFATVFRVLLKARSPMVANLYSGHTKEFMRAWEEAEPVLRFTVEEHERGQQLLAGMGIPKGASFICFGLREAAYYQEFLTPEAQARYSNPEDREDTYIRNPPLRNYVPMAVQCANLGLYVLRMGKGVDEPLPAGLHPNIIDYASKHRTPFGDIYLLANCKFVVAGAAGLWWISTAFNGPVVMTDNSWLWGSWLREGDLFIPKKLWLISGKRFLTFREMLAVDSRYTYKSNCLRDGVELVHNTPEEITAVVLEMNQRLDGTWQSCEEDEELQRRFKALYPPDHPGYHAPGRIGVEFLRQHSNLL